MCSLLHQLPAVHCQRPDTQLRCSSQGLKAVGLSAGSHKV